MCRYDVCSYHHRSWIRCSTYSNQRAIATTLSRPTSRHSPCITLHRRRSVTAAVVAAVCWDSICAVQRAETMQLLDRVHSLVVLLHMPPAMRSSPHCVSILVCQNYSFV